MIAIGQIGADEDLSREVLVVGLSIAPCIAGFADDSEEQKNALAVLRRVYKDTAQRGSRFIRQQSVGSASVSYSAVLESAFDGQPTRALRALCAAAQTAGGHSRATFPAERPISRMWPESTA